MNTNINVEEIQRKILKLANSKQVQSAVGAKAVDVIYKRVKSGYGVTSDNVSNPSRNKLKKLSPSYIDYRKGKVKFFTFNHNGKTWVAPIEGKYPSPVSGEFGSPARSNLTLTGKMLKAMSYRFYNGSVVVYIKNTSRGDGKTNSQVADYVREERPFMALTTGEQRIVRDELERIIKNNIRNEFRS